MKNNITKDEILKKMEFLKEEFQELKLNIFWEEQDTEEEEEYLKIMKERQKKIKKEYLKYKEELNKIK